MRSGAELPSADFAPPMAGTSDSDDRAQIVHVGA
jgi:hypothetical protein